MGTSKDPAESQPMPRVDVDSADAVGSEEEAKRERTRAAQVASSSTPELKRRLLPVKGAEWWRLIRDFFRLSRSSTILLLTFLAVLLLYMWVRDEPVIGVPPAPPPDTASTVPAEPEATPTQSTAPATTETPSSTNATATPTQTSSNNDNETSVAPNSNVATTPATSAPDSGGTGADTGGGAATSANAPQGGNSPQGGGEGPSAEAQRQAPQRPSTAAANTQAGTT